jgi:hypothetical protein
MSNIAQRDCQLLNASMIDKSDASGDRVVVMTTLL